MNTTRTHVFLASQSPRRRDLLEQIGVSFEVLDVDIDEVVAVGEPALDYVRRVAREKAGAGLVKVAAIPHAIVLAADTEVVLDDVVFGKPVDAEAATQMLRQLSGRTHKVLSAVVVLDAGSEAELVSTTTVRFAHLSEADIADYVATGQCFGKAGAYAIQGYAARFVEHIEGSYSGVMGLPLHETALLLRQFER